MLRIFLEKLEKDKVKDEKKFIISNLKRKVPGVVFTDNKRGLILTTGTRVYVGTDRSGDNLYANSVVVFDLNEKLNGIFKKSHMIYGI